MKKDYTGQRITIMGLGLNGGGVASARFFVHRGAQVTVTDLRTEVELAASLEALKGLPLRFVLGRHDEADFREADLVVKNPAVRPQNPYLALARQIATDLSVFLSEVDNPVYAVTGSKGKSTTATALHAIFQRHDERSLLGGNIAVSPLSFLDQLRPGAPVILELSSWQLADLRGMGVLQPQIAAVTNLLWDHMNVYARQEDYAADKAVIFEGQTPQTWSLVGLDDWGRWFAERTKAQKAVFSLKGRPETFPADAGFLSWLDQTGGWGLSSQNSNPQRLLPENLRVPGPIFRGNCLIAATMAYLAGVPLSVIHEALEAFPGVSHRLELFWEAQGVQFFDDTAATIPEAAVSSFSAFTVPVRWLAGGTDKNLDLKAWEELSTPPATLVLLGGSATDRLLPVLKQKGWTWSGPFRTMKEAVSVLLEASRPGDVVLLSPGAASFELFLNEFDRGRQFQNAVRELRPQGRRP